MDDAHLRVRQQIVEIAVDSRDRQLIGRVPRPFG